MQSTLQDRSLIELVNAREGDTFYGITRHGNNKTLPDRLYTKPSIAIFYEILRNPEVRPIVKQDLTSRLSYSILKIPDENIDDFVLHVYTLRRNIDPNSRLQYNLENIQSNLFNSDNYVWKSELSPTGNKELDYLTSMQKIAYNRQYINLNSRYIKYVDIINRPIIERRIRLNPSAYNMLNFNPEMYNVLELEYQGTVNWNVWYFMILYSISKRFYEGKNFGVGDIIKDIEEVAGTNYITYGIFTQKGTLGKKDTLGGQQNSISTPGQEFEKSCFKLFRGPYNSTATSCFMDSVIVAMFAFKNSPFSRIIDTDNISNDDNRSAQLRFILKNDVTNLRNGISGVECSGLRNYISTNYAANLLSGLQDAHDFYMVLTQALKYEPMMYSEVETFYSDLPDDSEEISEGVKSDTQIIRSSVFPSFYASDNLFNRINFNQDGVHETRLEEIDIEALSADSMLRQFNFKSKTYKILPETDVIVIHVDRRHDVSGIHRRAMRRMNTFLQNGGGGQMGSPIPEGVFEYQGGLFTQQDINNLRETAVNSKQIDIPMTITIAPGMSFTLKSVVYTPNDGHYQCLIKCGANWFVYNDMNVSNFVSQAVINDQNAINLIQTRGSLLFYHKDF